VKTKAVLTAISAGLSAVILSGCVVTGTTYVREERRPPPPYYDRGGRPVVVVERQPADVIIVHRAPPPVIIERIPARPGPEVVWVPGYYAARGDNWVWMPGHYERPPRAGAVWVEPRHAPRSATEYEFSMGFWR
jgi:hypothetical protein